MTIDEMFNELENKVRDTVIVTLKYKYDFEENYTIENHILEYDAFDDSYFWLNDWYEGQTDIEVLGYMPLGDVDTTKLLTCEDAISRQEAIKEFQIFREYSSNRSNADWVDRIETVLKDLPSVTPWSDWIPVSEKLPEPLTAVLLTVRYKSTGQWTYQMGYWEGTLEKWERWLEIGTLDDEFEILAWMELPERYEEGNHE